MTFLMEKQMGQKPFWRKRKEQRLPSAVAAVTAMKINGKNIDIVFNLDLGTDLATIAPVIEMKID